MYSTGIQASGQNQLYNITPAANPTTNPNPVSTSQYGNKVLNNLGRALWNNRGSIVNLVFTVIKAIAE